MENSFYEPFGRIIENGKSRYDFTGKEFDSLTQDYDFNARRYNPNYGKFLQPDTLIQNVYDPQFLNRYAFERNNPVKNKDDDGHWVHIAVAAGIGAVVNVGVYLYTHDDWTAKGALSYAGSGALVGAGAAAGGVAGAVAAGAAGRELERWADGKSLTDSEAIIDAGFSGAVSGVTAGLSAKFLRQPNPWNLKRLGLANFLKTPTGLQFIGNNLAEGSFSTFMDMGKSIAFSPISSNLANQRENLVQQIISSGSSEAVFGSGGGSGYSSRAGGYVTSDGHVYPTNNRNWKPNPNAPRYTPPPPKPKP